MTIVPAFCKAVLSGHKLLQRLFDVLYMSKAVTLPIRFGFSSSWQTLKLALCLTGMLTYMRIVLRWLRYTGVLLPDIFLSGLCIAPHLPRNQRSLRL